jgi:hypothetical protein
MHALDRARTVVRPFESIGAEARRRRGPSDEMWTRVGIGAHEVHVVGAREAGHASAVKRTTLEFVLDDEDTVARRAVCRVDAAETLEAPSM